MEPEEFHQHTGKDKETDTNLLFSIHFYHPATEMQQVDPQYEVAQCVEKVVTTVTYEDI